jgi:hypothetical protein
MEARVKTKTNVNAKTKSAAKSMVVKTGIRAGDDLLPPPDLSGWRKHPSRPY